MQRTEMRILAVDPATFCGWAHSCGQSGTWNLSASRDESSGIRLLKFRNKLSEVMEQHGIDVVVYEAVRYATASGALVVLSELQGVLKLWCHENKIEYRGYSSTAIKMHATGSGRANKDAMVDAAVVKWKRVFQDEDNNEVDALWILDFAKKELCA